MPGFSADMIPALRLDYEEVNRRVGILKDLLDRAEGADIRFRHAGGEARCTSTCATAPPTPPAGCCRPTAWPATCPRARPTSCPTRASGTGEPSRSAGVLPVQFGDEIVCTASSNNRAVEVLPGGAMATAEAELLRREPAYGNLAELGLGVLAAFGVTPIGEVLLDEKLGLHIAFGRSDHFGGQVAPRHFSGPEAVVHIDRVYVPGTQPAIQVPVVDLVMEDGSRLALMRDGDYIVGLFG